MKTRKNPDVVVIGSGPAGSYCAYTLEKMGLHALVIDYQKLPRYHIGESLTGAAGDIVRELHLEEEFDRIDFPGKMGVKVIGHNGQNQFYIPVPRPTWQVRRAEFDQILQRESKSAGAEHIQARVTDVLRDGARVVGVKCTHENGEEEEIYAKCVVDCSGQGTFLAHLGVAGPRIINKFSRQMAIFSQYENAFREEGQLGKDTVIFYGQPLHWSWFIPLSSTVTSIGVVIPTDTYKAHGKTPEEVLAWGLHHINPDLENRLRNAKQVESVRVIRNYSYSCDPFVGDGWICVGDAHKFFDPIFSFGVAFSFAEGRAAAKAIVEGIRTGDFKKPFYEFTQFSELGQSAAADLIRYFWRFPAFFSFMTKGKTRQGMIDLLAGDCFCEPSDVLKKMRTSLATDGPLHIEEGKARDIAWEIFNRYKDYQGVDAAYLAIQDNAIRASLVLTDNNPELDQAITDFEEKLYREFGRENFSMMRWIRAEDINDDLPDFSSEHTVIAPRRTFRM